MREVTESITTAEDGETTVNERLSPGGPGPEGQPDTATERLSGSAAVDQAETEATVEETVEPEKPKKK